jgi:hypothetical protein
MNYIQLKTEAERMLSVAATYAGDGAIGLYQARMEKAELLAAAKKRQQVSQ